ncbi:V-type ATP synthase subunit D [Thalassoroseus pseudoceratinae]|uniref:V-type ATP synthase subunit D n=1 Tax=Thalassoroseus pseudoceratinae TaxID=2713176 RepID=UPI001421D2E6|nr:V-type ATP synthase subunit D [Thalassoroseus pseudoceratinae]
MRLALNKNSLKQQQDQLGMFRKFLPSLDLKRQQLQAAWKDARTELARLEANEVEYRHSLEPLLSLLGSSTLQTQDLSRLVQVRNVVIEEENIVGARVPVVREIEFERTPYSTLTFPFWVDQLVESLENLARLRVELQAQQTLVERLEQAARKITQRVNLFEKVLIPNALENIKRIRIALSDEERAAVVRSKLAKQKNRN